jgi:hypothetical protein
VELEITGFSASGGQTKRLESADWVLEGGGRRIEGSGNPLRLSLPASRDTYRLTLTNPDGITVTKRFDFPVDFSKIELLERN